MANPNENKPGFILVYTKTIRHRSGKVLHASAYGLEAFAIWVKAKK